MSKAIVEDPLVARMGAVYSRVGELEAQGQFKEAAEYQASMLVKIAHEYQTQQFLQQTQQFVRNIIQCNWSSAAMQGACSLCGYSIEVKLDRKPMADRIKQRRRTMSDARSSRSRSAGNSLSLPGLDGRLRSLSAAVNRSVKNLTPSVLDKGALALSSLLVEGEATGYDQLEVQSLCEALDAAQVAVVGAIGPTLALVVKNDEGNLRKLRAAAGASTIFDGTVEGLLKLEVAKGLHVCGPSPPAGGGAMLKDPSGAMALLWLLRSFKFAIRMFELLSDAPDISPYSPRTRPTVPEAVAAAYADVLAPYHKWPMRTTFNLVAKGAPSFPELVERFSPPRTPNAEKEPGTLAGMRRLVEAGYPLISMLEEMFAEMELEDVRPS